MVGTNNAQALAHPLQRIEEDGDIERFVTETHARDARLSHAEQSQELSGLDGTREFWPGHRSQFSSIRSRFDRVAQREHLRVLEWLVPVRERPEEISSTRGVSVLAFDGGGRVKRFATYFDTAAFVRVTVDPRQGDREPPHGPPIRTRKP